MGMESPEENKTGYVNEKGEFIRGRDSIANKQEKTEGVEAKVELQEEYEQLMAELDRIQNQIVKLGERTAMIDEKLRPGILKLQEDLGNKLESIIEEFGRFPANHLPYEQE